MTVVQGDALALPLPDASVDLIVTSPPYFALRSYRDDGEHYAGQIGSESTPELFLDALDACMVEVGRVLKPSGSVFINLGDKYAGAQGQTHGSAQAAVMPKSKSGGMRSKSLMGLPWRHAIRQIDNGWILRAEIIWSKPNGLPESVTDRVRRSHEQWFHFTKEPHYFSAVDEIREPHAGGQSVLSNSFGRTHPSHDLVPGQSATQQRSDRPVEDASHPLGRLPGSVWSVPTEPLKVPDHLNVDHFAAFPQEWPRRLILGWSPEGGTVLDPFGGTGTVAGVARKLGRIGISLDLSMDYSRLARWRIHQSGHFDKTLKRTMSDRQGVLVLS